VSSGIIQVLLKCMYVACSIVVPMLQNVSRVGVQGPMTSASDVRTV